MNSALESRRGLSSVAARPLSTTPTQQRAEASVNAAPFIDSRSTRESRRLVVGDSLQTATQPSLQLRVSEQPTTHRAFWLEYQVDCRRIDCRCDRQGVRRIATWSGAPQ